MTCDFAQAQPHFNIEVKFSSEEARKIYEGKPLQRGSNLSIGYDLRAVVEKTLIIPSGTICAVSSGLKINFPANKIAAEFVSDEPVPLIGSKILPRSGRGTKEGLCLANTVGLIDPDYQGDLIVMVWARPTPGIESICIEPGERIAQLVFEMSWVFPESLIKVVDEFSASSARGDGGFGSTGNG